MSSRTLRWWLAPVLATPAVAAAVIFGWGVAVGAGWARQEPTHD